MKTFFRDLYRKHPYLDSVLSLIFGAIIGYLFQNIIDTWKLNGTTEDKLRSIIYLLVTIFISGLHYRFFYTKDKESTMLDEEREKSQLQRMKNDDELTKCFMAEAKKELKKENLSITQKAEILNLSRTINDNKFST